jgi:hypothetical protein
VFISHDLASVEHVCGRALLMRNGRMTLDGAGGEVVAAYRRSVTANHAEGEGRGDAPAVSIARADFFHPDHESIRTGAPMQARVSFVTTAPMPEVHIELSYYTHGGSVLHCQQTTALSAERVAVEPGPGVVEFTCPELALQPGVYTVIARAVLPTGSPVHTLQLADRLVVEPGKMVSGYFYQPHTSRVIGELRHAGSARRSARR